MGQQSTICDFTKEESQTMAVGAGYYFFACLFLAYYPAFVWAIQIVRWGDHMESTNEFTYTGQNFFILVFLALYICINRMLAVWRESWPFLVGLYATTLWPFIQYVSYYSAGGGYE